MPSELPEGWKSLLRGCKFELARRELSHFFEIANQDAASRGQEVCYRTEFVAGWHRFRDHPCLETAILFLEDSPEYAGNMFGYFIECCPGGRFAFYDSLADEARPSADASAMSQDGSRTDGTLPIELGRRCLAIVERIHQKGSPGELPKMIATRRNALAVVSLPDGLVAVRAATNAFRFRMFLWVLAGATLGLSLMLSWWILLLSCLAMFAERIVAARERRFWNLLAAMLLSAEILASDFAGWGTAHPAARQIAIAALGAENGPSTEWLDYYLPGRADLGEDVVTAFGPTG